MTEVTKAEPSLTLDQGYAAAYYFIRQFYERDGRKPESMFFLLCWMELEGPRQTSDPAFWNDWLSSVAKAIEHKSGDFSSEPLPEPLSQ
jgi:hypothetical protein